MRISTDTGIFAAIGDCKKIVKLIKDGGFDAYDFTLSSKPMSDLMNADDYLEQAKAFREYADSIGIECNQSHAPFPSIRVGDEEYNTRLFGKLVRAIEISGILGARVCVVHACNDYTMEENIAFYKSLEPYARKAGIQIGVENLYSSRDGKLICGACSPHDSFKAYLDLLPADAFTACLDIGHAEILGEETSAVKMIETLGDRLTAMHLHDVDKSRDNHLLPFTLKLDFPAIIEALRKINYQGDITLEACHFVKKMPVELLPGVAKLAADVAGYFRKEIQK